MTPEEKFELMQMLLECGIEMRTYYKSRRIVGLERVDSHVVIRYEDGTADKIHMRDFARRRFVVVL
jgi:hypothetical protein